MQNYWVEDSSYDQDSQGMWFGDIQGFAYSVNCTVHDQGFLAPSYSNARPAYAPDPHHPEYYFDPTVPIPQDSNC
ncbi:hypothetical protein ACQP1O_33355 [Nocardia sp. CA-151230]|uniref:hypothetical protein n=1 Tax=Nocardia sp. CA-151230 TaxID=3239982 RepID=UPI003D90DF3E